MVTKSFNPNGKAYQDLIRSVECDRAWMIEGRPHYIFSVRPMNGTVEIQFSNQINEHQMRRA